MPFANPAGARRPRRLAQHLLVCSLRATIESSSSSMRRTIRSPIDHRCARYASRRATGPAGPRLLTLLTMLPTSEDGKFVGSFMVVRFWRGSYRPTAVLPQRCSQTDSEPLCALRLPPPPTGQAHRAHLPSVPFALETAQPRLPYDLSPDPESSQAIATARSVGRASRSRKARQI